MRLASALVSESGSVPFDGSLMAPGGKALLSNPLLELTRINGVKRGAFVILAWSRINSLRAADMEVGLKA